MEAGTSDKDKVEAPNGMVETCSIFMYFLLQRPVREEETHRSIPLQDLCRAFRGFVWNYQDVFTFPAVHYVWGKDVNGAILPWVDFYERCQE